MTEHAVVLGAGIAGLLATAALAEAGHQITIIERDRLPDKPSRRRGVPQGPHLHSVLSKGWQVLDELVPGVIDDVVTAGAHTLDDARLCARMHIQNGPHAFNRTDPVADPAALAAYLVTRPQLEYSLRKRVTDLPNVDIIDGHDVGELMVNEPDRITHVLVADRRTGRTRSLQAGLVVDATGRATRTPLILDQLGYPRPPKRSFTVHGVYYSQQITVPDQDSFPERLVLVIRPGGAGRGGMVAGEHQTWTLTIAAHENEHPTPPKTLADMLTLAESFVPPHIYRAVCRAEPLSDVAVYHYPGGTWHRYDRCARLPDGLVVIGDALCSLDPIQGQGITMAARHALLLRAHMRERGSIEPQHFYRSLADIITPVWAANRPPGPRRNSGIKNEARRQALTWTRRRMLEAAGDDIVVTERLVRVVNMIGPPQRLLEPRLLARVAAHHARRALHVGERHRCRDARRGA